MHPTVDMCSPEFKAVGTITIQVWREVTILALASVSYTLQNISQTQPREAFPGQGLVFGNISNL